MTPRLRKFALPACVDLSVGWLDAVPVRSAVAAEPALMWRWSKDAATVRENGRIVPDPREGVWLGSGELYIHQSRDKWTVFPAGANVNNLLRLHSKNEQELW